MVTAGREKSEADETGRVGIEPISDRWRFETGPPINGMFHEIVDQSDVTGRPDDDSDEAIDATALLAAFEAALVDAIDAAGHDRVVAATPLDEETVDATAAGDVRGLTVEEGVSVLAAANGRETSPMVAELRDHLLMGMATAVLDVDTIAASIDADLTGQEVQQTLEGRATMTLEQLADIMAVIERRKP